MDATARGNGHGLLHAVENIMSSVFIPSLRKLQKGWGHLENESSAGTRNDFLNNLESFVSVLVGENRLKIARQSDLFFFSGAQESLDGKVVLKPCETYDLRTIQTPSDCMSVANRYFGLGLKEITRVGSRMAY